MLYVGDQGQLMDFEKGTHILRGHRLRESDNLQIQNSLITFYGHFGDVNAALNVFRSMMIKETDPMAIESVNAMMTGYLKNDHHEEALTLYDRFPLIHDDVSHLLQKIF